MQYSGGPGSVLSNIFSSAGPITTLVTSVEKLVFGSLAGQSINAQFNYAQFAGSGILEIAAGAGRDSLVIVASAPGSYSLDGVTFSGGWAPAPVNAWEASTDGVTLVASTPGNVTLTATAGLPAIQTLVGNLGNDTLIGSDNADRLNGAGGSNQLFGNGGNDILTLANQSQALAPFNGAYTQPTFYDGSGSLYSGGAGTDVLSIGGYVNFRGTLDSIEGIILLPEIYSATNLQLPRQAPAELVLDSARVAMLPTDTFFLGTGTVIILGEDGVSFDGSQYTFLNAGPISFDIRGGVGDGLSFVGTSRDDLIQFGGGIQTATGGAGADRFAVNFGNGTVTDFTPGVDQVDLHETGVTTLERLADFLSDGPNGAQLVANDEGQTYSITLQGVSLASLTADDFVLDSGGYAVYNPGTPLDEIQFGFQFNDFLSGGDGKDRIYSGGGRDLISGGNGEDTVVIDGVIQFGSQFEGGADYDTLVMRPSAMQVVPQFGALASFAGSTLSGFEALKFDSKAGDSTALQVIVGVWQMGGLTTVIGGAGTDAFIISANLSPSNTYSIPVLNLVDWQAGDYVVLAVGTGTADTTLNSIAHAGLYALSGGIGDDTLNGSSGMEVMRGNGGDDTFTSGGGADQIDGGADFDTALFNGNYADHAVFVTASGQLIIDGATYSNIELFRFANGAYVWDGAGLVPLNHPPVANADVVAVDEDATATGNVLGNDSTGESDPAADHLVVTSVDGVAITAPTVFHGVYGTLTIGADGAYSYVADADILDALPAGTSLSESFAYTVADDFGVSAASSLTFNVSTIADLVSVTLGNGAAEFAGTGADEIITSGRGDDAISGGAGSDRIYGGLGSDILSGGDGFDILSGGNGADQLLGGNGDDVLSGGRGADSYTGGSGADVFDFGALGTDRDRITDFEFGIDHLHLSDGVTMTGMRASGSSTIIDLSSGGSILLMGVSGVADPSALFTADLPAWTIGATLF